MVKSFQQCGKIWENTQKNGSFIFTFTTQKNAGMFVGEYNCKLDNRGRVLFPAALKRQLPADQQERYVLKRDLYEKCLLLYPVSEWEKLSRLIKKRLNPFNKEHALFLREFYRGTAEIVLDASGRILIPKKLYDYMECKGNELVFAGQDGKIEIWSADLYESKTTTETDVAALAEKILGGDFYFEND